MYKRAIEIYRSEGITSLLQCTAEFIQSNTTEPLINSYRIKKYQLQYKNAAPNPNKLIYVNPNSIEYMIVPALRYKYSRTGTYILGNDWDILPICDKYFSTKEFKQENNKPALLPFSKYGLYQSIKHRYKHGVSWEKTDWYQYYISNLEDTQYNSKKEVEEKFQRIDKLYNQIKSKGYKTQQELGKTDECLLTSENHADEILIDIDRNGRLLFEDGRHRLAIAKVLELEEIPVRVLVRHTKWQNIRSRIVSQETEFQTKDIPNIFHSHPDLQQI